MKLERDTHRIIKRITIVARPHARKEYITWLKRSKVLIEKASVMVGTKGIEYIIRFIDNAHVEGLLSAMGCQKGVRVVSIEDEILRMHAGGKIAVSSTVAIPTVKELRMVYTPGVAQVCKAIQEQPALSTSYTWIGNTVCIATNGSAVLGLGDIGVLAGMPVMEGKSVIINKMAGVGCVPILIESSDAQEIVDTLSRIHKTFGLIMIEDIKAPLCFEVEQALQKLIPIPVFHDDQHGTATVILAALIRALTVTGKTKEQVSLVINGAGAAGVATTQLLLEYGFRHITLCDREGALYQGRDSGMNSYKEHIATITNKGRRRGILADILKGADVFIGLSGPGLVTPEMVAAMNTRAIVFGLANPVPEIWPHEALAAGAAISLDGKVINNALVFPGLIKGTLMARCRTVTSKMKFAAAETLARICKKNEIVPDFMIASLHVKVAEAVCKAA